MTIRGRTDVYINDVRLGTATEWTLNLNRNYVDATAFGDTNRTYLVGLPEVVGTFQTDEGAEVNFRLPWNRRNAVTLTNEPVPELRINDDATPVEQPAIDRRLYQLYTQFGNWPTPEHTLRLARDLEAKNAKAYEKSKNLLLSKLTAEQLAQIGLQAHRFTVQGEHLKYLIYLDGRVGTLKPFGTFCINPTKGMPGPDKALALKYLIEHDEQEFLRVANWSGTFKDRSYSLAEMRIDGTVEHRTTGHAEVYGAPPGTGARTHMFFDWNFTTFNFDET